MYFGNNLGPGQHSLTLTVNQDQSGQQSTGKYFDIDFVTVYSADDSGGSNAQASSPGISNKVNPSDSSSSTATSPFGVISATSSVSSSAASSTGVPQAGTHTSGSLKTSTVVGIVVGTAAFLAMFIAAIVLIYRRRSRRRGAKLPIQAPRESAMRPKSNMTFSGFGAPTIRNPFADPAGQPPLPALRASSPTPSGPTDPFNVPGLEIAASEGSFYSTDDYDVESQGGHMTELGREGPGRESPFRAL
ncbi:hypothetical protein OF83DRAFT_353160 [Amylostereum chailletii]|nr:hypothetical protein OF83DRAFT_353160 [Amylostereum chailletii]